MSVTTQQPTGWPAELAAGKRPMARPRPRVTLLRVALSAALMTGALLFTARAGGWLLYTPLGFLYISVAIAGGLGGLGLGIATMLATLVLAELWVFEPSLTLPLTMDVFVRDGVFIAVSLSMLLLLDRVQRARSEAAFRYGESLRYADALRERASELELQVTEAEALAKELEHVNAQLAAQTDVAQRAVVRAQRLREFTALLLERSAEADVATAIVEDGRRALEAAAAVVVRTTDGEVQLLASGGSFADLLGDPAQFCQPGTPVFDAVASGDAVWIGDGDALRRDYPSLAHLADGPHFAWAAIPLQVEQRRLGCIALGFDRPGEFSPEDRSFTVLLAQQCAQALDRARFNDLQRRARVRAEFAERRLAFLADASERLASSLDFLATLANLAEYAVPEFADWCLIHLAGDRGVPLLIAAAHEDRLRLERRRQIELRYPPSATAQHGIGSVLRTGEGEHLRAVTDDMLRSVARDDEHLQLMRKLHLREQLAVPIKAQGRTVGVITFAITESSRTFDEADITLAEELGLRAGQAVQNAKLYQAAQHASDAKSNFLAIISHELRTPLNAIIGYSDLLTMGVPNQIPEGALHQVDRIRISAAALLALVDEVLSFSRIEAGKEEIRISPVELNTLIRECLTLVEPLALQKQLDVRINVSVEPVKIVSDERKIRQILTNLLSNAVKFTERGEVAIELRRGTGEVQLVVADTGIGISQENLERIFDPFWQVEPASTRRFGGTGLGLGVARKLARLLDGRLEVTSEEGKGSTFVLALPLTLHHIGRAI